MLTSKFGDARMDQNVGFFPLYIPVLLISSGPALFTEKEGQVKRMRNGGFSFYLM